MNDRTKPNKGAGRSTAAFTLVEILIVVVILGILAAIVVPQFTSAAEESRENSMQMSLHRMRIQLEIYKNQHNNTHPTLAEFVDQMTLASDEDGNTAAPGTAGFGYGPYIRQMPKNPNTGGSTIGTGEVGTSDWYYNEATGAFHPNDSEETRAF